MIVFNLTCSQEHRFDGWFRSSEDFEKQSERGLVECPVCGDKHVEKKLSAPRINTGAAAPRAADAPAESREMMAASMIPGLQEYMLKRFKEYVLAHSENVGEDFAETARRMHYGEEAKRSIRGKVSSEESEALREEGIETVILPPGLMLDEGLQ